jgi:hypothetical protein
MKTLTVEKVITLVKVLYFVAIVLAVIYLK